MYSGLDYFIINSFLFVCIIILVSIFLICLFFGCLIGINHKLKDINNTLKEKSKNSGN